MSAIALFAIAPAVYAFMSYYSSLQQEVIERFSGKRWTIPSRIYSDSVTIYRANGWTISVSSSSSRV